MTIVNCPTCEKEVVWSTESKYRPFCSERCQLIDLGEWANEEKRIAGNQTDNDVMSSDLV
ncbi:zinc-binding protein [Actinobacillus indolicus]|nr:zinc-binding protein [Actinobacillus indolicus]VTU08087.1 zinc-binding protein [Actinobacillus indolicus]